MSRLSRGWPTGVKLQNLVTYLLMYQKKHQRHHCKCSKVKKVEYKYIIPRRVRVHVQVAVDHHVASNNWFN